MRYVYRITNTVENRYYYGSRKYNPDIGYDIGITYFSSSTDKKFIQDQLANPGNYKYKVICCFDDNTKALNLEVRLHKRFDVKNNPAFYNLANQTSKGFTITPEIGKQISKSHKRRFEAGLSSNKGHHNPRHGDHRSYAEIHGEEKAKEIQETFSILRSGNKNSNSASWKLTGPDGTCETFAGNCSKTLREKGLSMKVLKKHLGDVVPPINKYAHRANERTIKTVGWKLEKL